MTPPKTVSRHAIATRAKPTHDRHTGHRGRFTLPMQTIMSHDDLDNLQLNGYLRTMLDAMPLMHVVEITLTALQSIYYMKLNDELSKFIKLFYNSTFDAAQFLLLFAVIVLYFTLVFHLLGAEFDDRDTFAEEYEGDYPFVPYLFQILLINIQNAVGELSPP